MQSNSPITQDLVLVGGGHSHAIVLKLFGMHPLPGVRLTLITDTTHTPYSGMLPGHVAGFYSFDETHIDLRRLARFAQAQLYLDRAVGLDLTAKKVLCAQRPPVAFDYLSIDIGSTPAQSAVTGAADYAIPAKPVPRFLAAWNQLLQAAAKHPQRSLNIGLIGGGAGGVELALNMQHHLHQELPTPATAAQIHLFHRGTRVLSGYSTSVSRRLHHILQQRGIALHLQESVSEIRPHKVVCESRLTVECDWVFWVTQASAPGWIRASGLATDDRGFVAVNEWLQSSHPDIFAAGDIATMKNYSRPKAGVFAVRQGKPLFKNLRRIITDKPLRSYTPQKRYLSLIGTGDRSAIASWNGFSWQSPLLWRWKDHIDRQFMRRFSELPEMGEPSGIGMRPASWGGQKPIPQPMYCAGCGSKVGSTVLARVLQRLSVAASPEVMVGLNHPDDAAVVRVNAELMMHTVDYFRSPIDDPFIFGQIATNHCFSDIYAMGGIPHSALAVVTVPYGTAAKVEETLYQLLAGATEVLQQSQTPLVGGHTTEGIELAFGLSVNGTVQPERLLRKSGMQPGQALLLTKALGTGTLLAADRRYQAKGRWIDGAISSMLLSNRAAAAIFQDYGATACTDVTGFGLLGHLAEMIDASGVSVQLEMSAIPVLEGALETVKRGITSSLQSQNLRASSYISDRSQINDLPKYPLLFDPQTAGGLLASVPAELAAECLKSLQAAGYPVSEIIGRIVEKEKTPAIAIKNSH
ncbi:MAG: selenide, water dikinase SelD [Cyanophyceae cyanobacterium]